MVEDNEIIGTQSFVLVAQQILAKLNDKVVSFLIISDSVGFPTDNEHQNIDFSPEKRETRQCVVNFGQLSSSQGLLGHAAAAASALFLGRGRRRRQTNWNAAEMVIASEHRRRRQKPFCRQQH